MRTLAPLARGARTERAYSGREKLFLSSREKGGSSMLTLLSVFYEATAIVYSMQETVVEQEMAKYDRDYTEAEFTQLMAARRAARA